MRSTSIWLTDLPARPPVEAVIRPKHLELVQLARFLAQEVGQSLARLLCWAADSSDSSLWNPRISARTRLPCPSHRRGTVDQPPLAVGVRFSLCPPNFACRLRERPLDARGALSVFRTRGSHGRLTDLGFLRSDDFGLTSEREDLRLGHRVRQRRAVLHRNRSCTKMRSQPRIANMTKTPAYG